MNNQSDKTELSLSVNPQAEIYDTISYEIDKTNNKLMHSVPTTRGNKFTKEYTGIEDLATSSQFMRNQTDEIISSTREFLEMLKKASINRSSQIIDNEEEHIKSEYIPSSLSSVYEYIQTTGNLNLTKNRK